MLGEMLTRGLDRLVERSEIKVQEMVDSLVQGNGFSNSIAKVRYSAVLILHSQSILYLISYLCLFSNVCLSSGL
jgi:hypothetical protein